MMLNKSIRRKRFLELSNIVYASFKSDSAAWQVALRERKLWENTLLDGLEEAPAKEMR